MTLSLTISLLINLLFIGMLIMIIFVALNKTLKVLLVLGFMMCRPRKMRRNLPENMLST